jgi:predicted site-specific integrase-resolvase
MAMIKTWYTPEEAEAKFGVKKAMILTWVEEGLVRCEREGEKVVRVNIDDVKLEAEAMVREH